MANIVITFRDCRQHVLLIDKITSRDMVESMSVGTKIRKARKARKLSQKALGELCGWTDAQSRISNYEHDEREPAMDDLRKIADALGEKLSYFVEEQPPGGYVVEGEPIIEWNNPEDLPEGQYVFVPRYEARVSAGNGHVMYEVLEKEQPQAFRTDWIKRRGLKSAGLMSVYAKGDSMEDRIHDGDSLLIDRAQKTIIDGKIYAIQYAGEVRVKRLYKLPDGGLLVHSDNKEKYPQITVSPVDLEHIEIIGRVVHISGEV